MIQTILQNLILSSQDEKGFVYNTTNKTLSINLDEICYILTNKVVTYAPSYDGKFVGEMMFNSTSAILYIWDGSRWLHYYPTVNGPTDARPSLTSQNEGFEYYDTTLNKKILWNGTTWVNLDGSSLDIKKSGTTAERPSNVEIGFIYKDTTLNKLILWEGSKWVNLDGSELS